MLLPRRCGEGFRFKNGLALNPPQLTPDERPVAAPLGVALSSRFRGIILPAYLFPPGSNTPMSRVRGYFSHLERSESTFFTFHPWSSTYTRVILKSS